MYNHLNFKYCTLIVSRTELLTGRWTDDPITSCPQYNLSGREHNYGAVKTVYAIYIGPSFMTDANSEGFPICDERITENDRCVIKIIGIHC